MHFAWGAASVQSSKKRLGPLFLMAKTDQYVYIGRDWKYAILKHLHTLSFSELSDPWDDPGHRWLWAQL